MCGITGFIGKRVNIEKFKIVSMWNEIRGAHSCGIYYDKKVYHGVDKEAKMSAFLQTHTIPKKLENGTLMLAHSRQSTMGVHNKDMAHPITISRKADGLHTNVESDEFLLVGVHNGKILNYSDLRLDKSQELSYNNFNLDSKVLFGRLLLAEDPKTVLESYRGAAAIMYTLDQGKTLHVFKGAAGGVEERPLFFLHEPEGMYFSSLVEPLLIIRTTDKKAHNLLPNVLFHFSSDGVISKTEIDRKKGMDEEEYKARTAAKTTYTTANANKPSTTKTTNSHVSSSASLLNINCNKIAELEKREFSETIGDIELRDLRYYHKNKPINGRLCLNKVGVVDEIGGYPYWFYEGIMVTEQGFLKIAERMITSPDDIFEEVSYLSRYPIFAKCVADVFRNTSNCNLLTYENRLFSGNIRPAFYTHAYVVKDGIIIDKMRRKGPKEELYKDQLYENVRNGSPVQKLRDHRERADSIAEDVASSNGFGRTSNRGSEDDDTNYDLMTPLPPLAEEKQVVD